jgi:hypothetical protein
MFGHEKFLTFLPAALRRVPLAFSLDFNDPVGNLGVHHGAETDVGFQRGGFAIEFQQADVIARELGPEGQFLLEYPQCQPPLPYFITNHPPTLRIGNGLVFQFHS